MSVRARAAPGTAGDVYGRGGGAAEARGEGGVGRTGKRKAEKDGGKGGTTPGDPEGEDDRRFGGVGRMGEACSTKRMASPSGE